MVELVRFAPCRGLMERIEVVGFGAELRGERQIAPLGGNI